MYDDLQENTVETLNDESEIVHQRRRFNERVTSPPYGGLSNERNARSQKRGEELDLSGSRKDCSSLLSNDQSLSKNPLSRICL